MFQHGRSRARGVQNIKNMTPMLRGRHILFDPCAAWGRHLIVFQHLCGQNARKSCLLIISKRFHRFRYLLHRKPFDNIAIFCAAEESVLPTQRGAHIFQVAHTIYYRAMQMTYAATDLDGK